LLFLAFLKRTWLVFLFFLAFLAEFCLFLMSPFCRPFPPCIPINVSALFLGEDPNKPPLFSPSSPPSLLKFSPQRPGALVQNSTFDFFRGTFSPLSPELFLLPVGCFFHSSKLRKLKLFHISPLSPPLVSPFVFSFCSGGFVFFLPNFQCRLALYPQAVIGMSLLSTTTLFNRRGSLPFHFLGHLVFAGPILDPFHSNPLFFSLFFHQLILVRPGIASDIL